MKILKRMSFGLTSVVLMGCQNSSTADLVLKTQKVEKLQNSVQHVLDANESTNLYVVQPPERVPQLTNAYAKSIYARHMGVTFDSNIPDIPVQERIAKTGISAGVVGSSQPSQNGRTPTFASFTGSSEFGYYVDTKELEEKKLFPFSVAYCKIVGLGAPQLSMDKNLSNQNIYAWNAANKKLEISMDLQVPVSELRVRTADGRYVEKSTMDLTDNVPVFISSSYLYLLDVKNNNLIAVLFNYYDPRGAYPLSIGNDNHVYFLSAPVSSRDMWGRDQTQFFTVESGQIQRNPFKGYKTFKISINQTQLLNMIKEFGTATTLSQNPADYRVQSAGVLNEMNYLYKYPASDCVPNYDPETYARVGMSFKNFSVTLTEDTTSQLPAYELRGYHDGILLESNNDFNVLGWACATGRSQPTEVLLTANGNKVYQGMASEVSEAGVNNLCQESSVGHRFKYRLTFYDFKYRAQQTLKMSITSPDGAKTLELPNVTPWPTQLPQFTGYLDGVNEKGQLRGWACAIGHNNPLKISIYVGETRISTVTANIVGEGAIGDLCKGSSLHRFEYNFSDAELALYKWLAASAKVEIDGESVYDLQKFSWVNYIVGK